ncbi:hypothetical protein WJ973_16285 [Achromobacter xylosoxidans]
MKDYFEPHWKKQFTQKVLRIPTRDLIAAYGEDYLPHLTAFADAELSCVSHQGAEFCDLTRE